MKNVIPLSFSLATYSLPAIYSTIFAQFIATEEQKRAITSSFGGMCCEMEGAAVAQACHLNDIPSW